MAQQVTLLEKELTTIYARYDRELRNWIASYDRSISCHKGCFACCDLSIGLYLPEAIVLANSLSDDQYAPVAEHAKRVLAYARETPDYLAGYRDSGIGYCPFLDSEHGSCTIYDRRPANCRHVFSNMPPEYCAKDTPFRLDRDPEQRAEFLQQLDPHVNEDDLPFIAPLRDIFYDHYDFYLMLLTAKSFNVIVLGEMSWLITLAREHDLRSMATGAATCADFYENVQRTGCYHEHVLTDCQDIPPHVKEQSVKINFAHLP